MGGEGPRALVLGMLRLERKLEVEAIARLCDGAGHSPAPLEAQERAALDSASLAGAPPWIAGDYPEWLDPHLAGVFGKERAAEGAALASRAPLDLRVNALKADRERVSLALAHLGAVLLPALERPAEASSLFIDHVALALIAHLTKRYGGVVPRETTRPRGLSLIQNQYVKEYLASNLSGHILVADLAKACGLSRSHFIRSFRMTTGMTPHKWLQVRRIEQAKTLLLESSIATAEIAVDCGFADQSHLTRVFTRLVGMPPSAWRREHRGRKTIGCVTSSGKQGWFDGPR